MATLIVVSTPRDNGGDAIRRYVEQVMPMLLAAGGNVVKRLAITDAVAGRPQPRYVMVMDFEDASSARHVFDSAEYHAIIPVRDEGLETIDIYITEDL
jgi:uncharacterized protein (DUF1330 family)